MPSQTIDHFLFAQEKGLLTDRAYLQALADCRRLARDEGLDATMAERQLDAVVALTGAPAWQEGKLLRLAYAFEQATQVRRPPQYLSSVAYG